MTLQTSIVALRVRVLACGLLAGACVVAGATGAEGDEAVSDGLVTSEGLRATVFGPDHEALAELPEHVPARQLSFRVDGARPTPGLYWFNRELRVWFSRQPEPAELVIVIAGTGGGANTAKQRLLRRALYAAGYHVLTVPSPTTPRFLVAGSSTGVGGDLTQDASDLRRAIRQSLARLPRGMEITGLHAIGYSLGGANAAVIRALDDGAEPLGVERVVMINPPVSLFASIERMDRLFERTIGDGDAAIERFYQRLYADLSALYQQTEAVAIDESFLLGAAGRLLSSDDEFAAAIALSFRIALIDLFFRRRPVRAHRGGRRRDAPAARRRPARRLPARTAYPAVSRLLRTRVRAFLSRCAPALDARAAGARQQPRADRECAARGSALLRAAQRRRPDHQRRRARMARSDGR